ncbi:hypothetical protein N305_05345, partial [Manacus vitellinus]
VGDEVGVLSEAFPAFPGALVGLHLLVGLLVSRQVRALGEALPTLLTLVGPLPSVGDEVGVLSEAFPAFPTWVRPFPSVDALVLEEVFYQVGVVPRALPTFPTHIGPFPSVDVLVLDQVRVVPQALAT